MLENKDVLTVSKLTYTIKNLLENEQMFKGFVIKGEISNFTNHRTGHLYFALKDENASIKAVMFQSQARLLKFMPKDGDKVTLKGSISLYAPSGTYSIQVMSMALDGAGELYLKYLELKEKLNTIGWFLKEKKKIPNFPKRIGVITSPTGAVIEDIKNTVNRRYRLTEIILYPALVQGTGAKESIKKQIELANLESRVDVLIVGRGGGSIEDLWAFNEIEVISAIYNSKIPIITAIGHETDDTISDLVSDLRAPTPTAAAELATPSKADLFDDINKNIRNIEYKLERVLLHYKNNIIHLVERLEVSSPINKLKVQKDKLESRKSLMKYYFLQILNDKKNVLTKEVLKINNNSPLKKLNENKRELEIINNNLFKNYKVTIDNKNSKLLQTINLLEKVNPLNIMKRGFSLVMTDDNKIVTSINEVKLKDKIIISMKDGKLEAIIEKKGE